jgi:hypothetical protein
MVRVLIVWSHNVSSTLFVGLPVVSRHEGRTVRAEIPSVGHSSLPQRSPG